MHNMVNSKTLCSPLNVLQIFNSMYYEIYVYEILTLIKGQCAEHFSNWEIFVYKSI